MFLIPSGERMHENKDPGRLLLLRVGVTSLSAQTRQELCQNGSGHVWSHQVSCDNGVKHGCDVNRLLMLITIIMPNDAQCLVAPRTCFSILCSYHPGRTKVGISDKVDQTKGFWFTFDFSYCPTHTIKVQDGFQFLIQHRRPKGFVVRINGPKENVK